MNRKIFVKTTIFLLLAIFLVFFPAIVKTQQKPEIVVQTGPTGEVNSVALSHDGKTLAAGSFDGTIKLWDLSSGQELRTLTNNGFPVKSLLFFSDDKAIFSVSGSKLSFWEVASGKELNSFDVLDAHSMVLSPDKTKLAIAEYKSVRILNFTTEQTVLLSGHTGPVTSIAFSPDGKKILTGSEDKTLKLWNPDSGQLEKSFTGHSDQINSVAFSPDGATLASGSSDQTIKLWDSISGKEIKTLTTGQAGIIESVAFSPDGVTLASGSQYYPYINGKTALILWNVSSGALIKSFAERVKSIKSVIFSADGKTLISGGDKEVAISDIESGREVKIFTGRSESSYLNDLSSDGKILATANQRTIKLWNLTSGKEAIKITSSRSASTYFVNFSPDNKILASGSFGGFDDAIDLWDVSTGQKLRDLKHNAPRCVAFSPDGSIIASGGQDKTIKLWEAASGKELRTIPEESTAVFAMAFSPDGKMIASESADGIRLLEVSSGKEIKKLVPKELVGSSSIAFSADGNTLAFYYFDAHSIRLWDVNTGKQVKDFPAIDAKTVSEVFAAVPNFYFNNDFYPVTPDGKFQMVSGKNGSLDFYEFKTGNLQVSLIPIDENDWAAVTPEGLFDGTPSAWKRLIWRLDNNTFTHAPVEAFFKEFYRPGLLQDIFAGNKIERPSQDLSELDIRQPEVKIIEIADHKINPSDSLSTDKRVAVIKIEVTDNSSKPRKSNFPASSGATDLRLFRNGSLIKLWEKDVFQLGKKDGCEQLPAVKNNPRKIVCETAVQIVSDKNEFAAYVFNHDSVKSNDAAAQITGLDSLKRQGTLYILAVGINDYADPSHNLTFAVADAEAIVKEIESNQTKILNKQYAHVESIKLTDKKATKINILNVLKRFGDDKTALPANMPAALQNIKTLEPEDALIIYYAGHGTASKDRFYLIPHDGFPFEKFSDERARLEKLYSQSVSDMDLQGVLQTISAGKMLMIVDACNSGQALESAEKRRGPMNSKGLAQLAFEKGMYILTAAQSQQSALEVTKLGHGLLTYALLEGLQKADKDNAGNITERFWLDYAAAQVPKLQVAAMQTRSAENKILPPAQKRSELAVATGDNSNLSPEQRGLQVPRIFYRRELEARPMIIAKP